MKLKEFGPRGVRGATSKIVKQITIEKNFFPSLTDTIK